MIINYAEVWSDKRYPRNLLLTSESDGDFTRPRAACASPECHYEGSLLHRLGCGCEHW